MSYILKNNLVFLHVPKTGGNWLSELLKDNRCIIKKIECKHATYDLVCGALRRKKLLNMAPWNSFSINNLKFFAVVRNPLKWYESWFQYQNWKEFYPCGISSKPYNWHVMSPLNHISSKNFNDFMTQINLTNPGFVGNMFNSYVGASNAIIIKNENIREQFSDINIKYSLGIREEDILASPKLNTSPKLEIVWDKDVFQETIKFEMATFKKFGYIWEGVVKVK